MDGFFLIFAAFLLLALVIRLAAGALDHDRIRDYLRADGGRVLEIAWTPFGPGWFGEKHARIYLVRYLDRDGSEHEAYCKTSMLSGVYFTEDRVVRYGDGVGEAQESLEEENRRLRSELERLKRGRG